MKTPYKCKIKPYIDSDETITIQWRFALDGAKLFTAPTFARPSVWDDNRLMIEPHLGEVPGTREYVKDVPNYIYPGTCFVPPDLSKWQFGFTQEDKGKIIPIPDCCKVKIVVMGAGGLGARGRGKVVIFMTIVRDFQAGGLISTFSGIDIFDVDEYYGIQAIQNASGEIQFVIPDGLANSTLIQYSNGYKRFNESYILATSDISVGIPSHHGIVDVDCTAGEVVVSMASATTVGAGYRVWIRKIDNTSNRMIIDFGTDSFLRGSGRTTLATREPYDAYLLGTAKYSSVSGVAHAWQVLAMAPTAAEIPSNALPAGSLLDTFTDADNTLLTAHVMDVGPGWTMFNGASYWIKSDHAEIVSNDSTSSEPHWCGTDAGASDGTLSVTSPIGLSSTASFHQGLAFRGTSASNYWRFGVAGLHDWSLDKVIAGGVTNVASGSTAASLINTVTVTLSGSSISCQCDGVTVATTTDSFNAAGTIHGLWGGRLNTWEWDDFSFTP